MFKYLNPIYLLGAAFRKSTPIIYELTHGESCFNCLSMIFKHYGLVIKDEILRNKFSQYSEAEAPYGLLKIAKDHDFHAQAVAVEPKDINKIKKPIILFWDYKRHVVLTEQSKNTFKINDPQAGVCELNKEQFEKSYSGIAYLLKPTKNFKAKGHEISPLKRLVNRVLESKESLIYALIISLLLVIPNVATTGLTRIFVDYYLVKKLDSYLWPVIIGIISAGVISIFMTWFQNKVLLRLKNKEDLSRSADSFITALYKPLNFFKTRKSGEVAGRIKLNESIATILSGPTLLSMINVFTVITYLAVMLFYNVKLSMITVSLIVINVILILIYKNRVKDENEISNIEKGQTESKILSLLKRIEPIQTSGFQNYAFSVWLGSAIRLINREQSVGSISMSLKLIPGFLNNISTILILCVGGHFVITGRLSVGELIAFQMLAGFATSPILALTSSIPSIINTSGNLKRLSDLTETAQADEFNESKDISDNTSKKATDKDFDFNGKIELKNISFSFTPTDTPILKDISLNINEGNQVMIVGEKNSGKSILANIIAGLETPSSGKILYNGHDRLDYERERFRRGVSLLDDQQYFFDGTVLDNLTMWHKYLNDDHIRKLSELTGLHEVLLKRPESYQQSIKQSGHGFSYGEFELLALTRILLLQPKVIVIDSLSYGLNNENIEKVLAYLRSSHISIIFFANTHTHLKHFERIIELKAGKITFDGRSESFNNKKNNGAKKSEKNQRVA